MAIVPIITLLLLFGLLTGANLFALGVSTLLIVIEVARFLSRRWAEAITVERQLQQNEIQVGDSFPIGIKLENKSGYWIPWILVEDRLPKAALRLPPVALERTGQSIRLQSFRAHQKSLMTYSLRARRRGYYQIGPAIIETGDLLGLHRSYRVVSQSQYLVVLPKILSLEGMEVSSRRPMGEMRLEERGMEDPTHMVGIRQYQAGDPINRVHWKATARTGILHTRVFQPTCIQGATLLVDMHTLTNPAQNEPIRTDLAVTATASIAHMLYSMSQPFGLISNGRDAADRVREIASTGTYTDRVSATQDLDMRASSSRLRPIVSPANRSPEHFADLHRTLARLERTDGLSLSELIMETESRLPRMLSVLAIVQQIDEPGALALAMLRRRGFAVSVIVNQHQDHFLETAASLAAHHLPVFSLRDEASVPHLCRNWLLQGNSMAAGR
jgi:hypothetical protein